MRKQDDFPARYPEVLSCKNMADGRRKNFFYTGSSLSIVFPYEEIYSTYLNNTYIKASGTSLAAAFVAGLSVALIGKYKKNNTDFNINPGHIYSEVSDLKYNPQEII